MLQVKNYLRKCVQNGISSDPSYEEWCSIFSPIDTTADVMILGTAVMRDYVMIFDGQLSRIGLAQKRT